MINYTLVTGHFKTNQPGRIKTGHSEVLNSYQVVAFDFMESACKTKWGL